MLYWVESRLENISGDFDYEGESNIIDVLVKNIRKKLEDPMVIVTKRGMGYVFKSEEKE